jgi:hypothetical protein
MTIDSNGDLCHRLLHPPSRGQSYYGTSTKHPTDIRALYRRMYLRKLVGTADRIRFHLCFIVLLSDKRNRSASARIILSIVHKYYLQSMQVLYFVNVNLLSMSTYSQYLPTTNMRNCKKCFIFNFYINLFFFVYCIYIFNFIV